MTKKFRYDVYRFTDVLHANYGHLLQRTLTVEGRITVQLVSRLTRLELTNEGNIILFVFSETV